MSKIVLPWKNDKVILKNQMNMSTGTEKVPNKFLKESMKNLYQYVNTKTLS